MKKIGLVGGIGPASTVDYYLGLIEETRKQLGETIYPEIVIDSVNLYEATEFFEKEDWDASANLMVKSVNQLQAAGAQIAAITANTEHIVWDKMKDRFSIPVVSIVDAVVEYSKRQNYRSVLVLGTSFTMDSGLYEGAFLKRKIESILPDEKERKMIGQIIYPNLENGILIEKDKKQLISMIESYVEKQKISAVLLGCTELPLMIKPQDVNVPVINSTQVHIEAIFAEANKRSIPYREEEIADCGCIYG